MARKKITLTELRNLIKRVIIEESTSKPVNLKIDGDTVSFFKQDERGTIYVYGVDEYGDTYIDISTDLPGNPLIDAIWVEVGGEAQKIANKLPFLSKTNRKTKSGFNKYIMYKVR